MKKENEHIITLFPAYLDNVLGDKEKAKVVAHLKICPACSEELEGFQSLFHAINQEDDLNPSDKLRNNFLRALEQEKNSVDKVVSLNNSEVKAKNRGINTFLKIAASIALLVGSFLMGSYQQKQRSKKDIAVLETESLEMKQTAMLSLIDNQSARKRIQGVNFITEFDNPDESIINALAERMLLDQNTNVRLSAVDALSNFAKSEAVTSAFIKALATEKNPSVQIALIGKLVRIHEKRAAAPMKELLEQEDTQPFVKEEINSVLSQII